MAAKDLQNIKAIEQANEALKQELNSVNNIADAKKRANIQDEINLNNQKLINEALRLQKENKQGTIDLTDKEKEKLNGIVKQQTQINSQLDEEYKKRRRNVDVVRDLSSQLKQGFDWLMKQDKIIKTTNINLGLSGAKAAAMAASFKEAGGMIASMGGRLEDVQKIMEGYADETGEVRNLSAQMVQDITAIGKGTGLGVEQATKLAGQFRFMGLDAKSTNKMVQGIVDTTERMGINTTKVLKNVNDNFKKLNAFTFQKGSKGMAEMAVNAEKTRVSIESTLNVADKGRSLEGAIEMMAQLQVMGGEFAKTDMLQFWHDARNNPEKITQQISDMTKGLVHLKKQADGTFENIISPADIDRLQGAAKAMGISREELVIIAQKRDALDRLDKVMAAKGLTGREKELVAGAAVFNNATAKYQVMVAGHMKDVQDLTKDEANAFVKQTVTLKQRAVESQTIEEAFKNAVFQLKTGLLPILTSINNLMAKWQPKIEKFVDGLANGSHSFLKAALTLLAAGTVWKVVTTGLGNVMGNYISKGFGGGKGIGGGPTIGKNGMPLNQGAQKAFDVGQVNKMNAGAGLAKAQGLKNLGTGAGIGVAAVGMGAGIGLAAEGISKLADSLSKLTPEQAKTLNSIVLTLGVAVGVLPLVAFAIAAFAPAAAAATIPMLGFGAAILLIGSGIGIAAAGIGYMATGLATLVTAGKDAGVSMTALGAGILKMGAGMALFAVGGLGFFAFSATINKIAKNADQLSKVGDAFKQINAVMSGSKEDYAQVEKTVNAVANMNAKGGGGSAFAQLASLLKTPLKVEFADKNVAIVSDITLMIDGDKFMHKIYKPQKAVVMQQDMRDGKPH